MKVSLVIRSVISCLIVITPLGEARAFVAEGFTWPKGATVVMHLGLGPTGIPLQDGFASWNASAADAVAVWNGYLDFINITTVSAPTVPQTLGDGINSIFFSDTILGDSFDEFTIAVTVGETTDDPTVTAEADIVVNNALRYGSYRGPQQSDASGDIIDFHRVVLHELGHVLGLDHEENDPPGQALMEPFISDLDHLGPDDVFGIRALYGAKISNLYGDYVSRVGDNYYFSELEANNSPTSFTATGLPPDVTIDSATGMMTGTTTTPGVYSPVVTAHGPISDAYGSVTITVSGLNEVPGLLAIWPTDATSLLADPMRRRLYAGGSDGLKMIDMDTGEVTVLVGGNQRPAESSLSADDSLLLYRAEGTTTLHRIDLESLTAISTLQIPLGYSQFLEGLDNRAYSSGQDGVYQMDATTGAVETTFSPSSHPQITITPDRKTLLVNDTATSLSSYDISTPSATLISTINGLYSYSTSSADSQHLYCLSEPSDEIAQLTDFSLPDFALKKLFGTPGEFGPIFVAPDGSLYQTKLRLPGSIVVFDSVSLQPSSQLDMTYPPFDGYEPFGIAFDDDGQFFYVTMSIGGSTEIWKFSTDFASFLPPDQLPTKNLSNISTRAKAGLNEDAMIGGFIVQGTDPKKLLIRGMGPSLPLTGALSDPMIDLYNSAGDLVATNDNWVTNRLNVIASKLAPLSSREAAIVATLDPGAYTAIVHDKNKQTGQALVEVYDLDARDSLLANISTRGRVETGDDVMIGGFIIGGFEAGKVLLRAIGPSLAENGITQPLADPVLELHNAEGNIIATNDDWRSTQQTEIAATGIAPSSDQESAIVATLDPGSYTAIVRGQNGTTGVALVEIYNLAFTQSENR